MYYLFSFGIMWLWTGCSSVCPQVSTSLLHVIPLKSTMMLMSLWWYCRKSSCIQNCLSLSVQVDDWHAFRPIFLPREGLLDSGKPGQRPLPDAARESAASCVPPQISPLPDRGQRDGSWEQRLGSGPRRHVRFSRSGRCRDRNVWSGAWLFHPPGWHVLCGWPYLHRGKPLQLSQQREPRRSDCGVPPQPEPDFWAAVRWRNGRRDSDSWGSDLHWGML